MEKLLLVENSPLVAKHMAYLLETAGLDVELEFADSFYDMEAKMQMTSYKMAIVCLSMETDALVEEFLEDVKRNVDTAFIVFSDWSAPLPEMKMYSAGVHYILDKSSNEKEFLHAVRQVKSNRNYKKQSNNFGFFQPSPLLECYRSLNNKSLFLYN